MSDNELCYKVPEVAKLLGLSLPTVYQQISAGTIPSLKFGRQIRIPKAAFLKKLEEAGHPKEN